MREGSRSVQHEREGRQAMLALASFLFILAAVVVEVVTSAGANSSVPAWAKWVVPIGWPPAVRVVWWLVVVAAALAFRLALSRLGFRQRRIVVVLSVAPFVVFAAGIAFGADWSTWH